MQEKLRTFLEQYMDCIRKNAGEMMDKAMPEADDYRTALDGQPLNENGTQFGDRGALFRWVLDQEAAEETPKPREKNPEPIQRPDFIAREKGLTPTERGTALHLAMQYLPLEGDHSPEAIGAELDRLAAGGFLTHLQREAVDPAVPAAFFASDLGRRLLASPEIHREFKFSLLAPPRTTAPGWRGRRCSSRGSSTAGLRRGAGSPSWTSRATASAPAARGVGRRSTAPSWRPTAGPWSGSPGGRFSGGCCGFLPRDSRGSCDETRRAGPAELTAGPASEGDLFGFFGA